MPYIKSLLSWIFQYTFPWLIWLCIRELSPSRGKRCVGRCELFTAVAPAWDTQDVRTPLLGHTACPAPCPVSSCGQKWVPKEKYQDYKEPLMIHSLNTLTVSRRLEGLPKAEIASGYLITLPAFLFHEPAGLPLNSRELLASMTCCGKELLSVTTRCVVSSETSPFIWTFYLPAPSDAAFVLEETASNRSPCIPSTVHYSYDLCVSQDLCSSRLSIPDLPVLSRTKLFHSITLEFNVRLFFPWEKGDGKMEVIFKHLAWLPKSNQVRKSLSVWNERFNIWLRPRKE